MNGNIASRHHIRTKSYFSHCSRRPVLCLANPSLVDRHSLIRKLRQMATAYGHSTAHRLCEDFPGRYQKTASTKPQSAARNRIMNMQYTLNHKGPDFMISKKERAFYMHVYTQAYLQASEMYAQNKFRILKNPSSGFRRYHLLLTSWRLAFQETMYGTGKLCGYLMLCSKNLDVSRQLVIDTVFELRKNQVAMVHDLEMLDFIWRHRFKLIAGDLRLYQHEMQVLFLKLDCTKMVEYWKVLKEFCCDKTFVGIAGQYCIPTDHAYWNTRHKEAQRTRKEYCLIMERLTGVPEDKELADGINMYDEYFQSVYALAHWRSSTVNFYHKLVQKGYLGLLDRLAWSVKFEISLRNAETEIHNIIQHLHFLASAKISQSAKAKIVPMGKGS